ncbi:hypothetical protein [Pseudoalteromonas luteoviolacea]|uniref:Uncharacterized protein n=1 Tax=Pseudoalteromonas luteoviolacea (strain 2ta16) TaxID=1353533 RepID=V4HZ96_PSEL2|nr:hypothetical protein [Pseudoalteromonas luteoviolacea]ESP93279.1 hypothetical protein PL2TA16_03500 [Pseudoalteromonas luteoviolacea 2ta16]MCG7550361.1 hypothetical protein [Pseudoalteromonas sp. Of7M-16]
MITKVLEWHLIFLGSVVVSLLYLQIVLSPVFFMGILGLISIQFFDQSTAIHITTGCALLGSILGFFWAERIRRSTGIITFHSYLLSTPEIDGYSHPSSNKLKK